MFIVFIVFAYQQSNPSPYNYPSAVSTTYRPDAGARREGGTEGGREGRQNCVNIRMQSNNLSARLQEVEAGR